MSRGGELAGNLTEVPTCSQLECKKLDGSLNVYDQYQRAGENPLVNLAVSAFEGDLLQVNEMMMDMLLKDNKTPPPSLSVRRGALDKVCSTETNFHDRFVE